MGSLPLDLSPIGAANQRESGQGEKEKKSVEPALTLFGEGGGVA